MGGPSETKVDAAIREVSSELSVAGTDPTRSVLLTLFTDALGSRDEARELLPRLEETLIEWRAWRPPRDDPKRAVVTRSDSEQGYRTAADGPRSRITLRKKPSPAFGIGFLGLLTLVLGHRAIAEEDWVIGATAVLGLILGVVLLVGTSRRQRSMVVEVDGRIVRAPDAEVPRADVRYVTSKVEMVFVGLGDGSERALVRNIRPDDALAVAAVLEEELGLLDGLAATGARVEVDDDAEPAETADASARKQRRRQSRAR